MKLKPGSEIAIVVAFVVASCATIDVPTPALRQARDAVRAAQTDPAVLSGAPLELRRATEALERADRALVNGEPPREIDHYSYVATRRAETAIAHAAAKSDEAAIKTAEVDRERTRADVRTLEAQVARADAEMQRAQAAAATEQAAIARQQALSARTQAAQANQLAAQSQVEAAGARNQAAQAQGQAILAQTAADQSRADAQAAEARANELQKRMAELEATKVDRGRLVTLGDVLFEFNRAEVRPTAQARLARLSEFLKQFPERKVLIEGHTDNVGSTAYNEQLSARRAESIRAQLMLAGVGSERMTTIGYGKDYPIASNDSDTNRALNRRVEVYISDTEQTVPPRR